MKQLIYTLAITFALIGCNKQPKQNETSIVAETAVEKANNSKFYTQLDTIYITTEIGDTLTYGKTDFNKIIDEHPEFFEEYPLDPYQTYYNNTNNEEFSSEAGQDIYYTLYAYFLKQRNGDKEFAPQRQKLIDIYLNINSLFEYFEYGGTYFGHQSSRILGYAEYSVCLMPKNDDEILKTYNIAKQKSIYIQSLRQLIEDENEIDENTLGNAKIERIKKLNKIVDELEKLITDNFYLKRAQEFQYSHYEYY